MNILKAALLPRKHSLYSDCKEPESAVARMLAIAENHFKLGEYAQAVDVCHAALMNAELSDDVSMALRDIEFNGCLKAAEYRFPGPYYDAWLAWFHTCLKPETYLEIGVESGKSLHLAAPPTRAVGIDPAIQVVHSQETWVKLFKLTSDDFFARHDLRQVLEAEKLDFAFIDGLHTFDQALKDFINAESYAHDRSVVVFHDIFPVVPLTALRERETRFWVGDTWKVMLILRKFRPDLNIFTIPTYPSGLGVVTGLDPTSTLLKTHFDPICEEARNFDLDACMPDLGTHLAMVENDFEAVARKFESFPSV